MHFNLHFFLLLFVGEAVRRDDAGLQPHDTHTDTHTHRVKQSEHARLFPVRSVCVWPYPFQQNETRREHEDGGRDGRGCERVNIYSLTHTRSGCASESHMYRSHHYTHSMAATLRFSSPCRQLQIASSWATSLTRVCCMHVSI